MKILKNQKGIAPAVIILIILLVVITAGVGGYFVYNIYWQKQTVQEQGQAEIKSVFTKIADQPEVTSFNDKDFFSKYGWWIRDDNEWVQFTFSNVDTSNLVGDDLTLKLKLGVTNKRDGDENLDGVVDVMLNPEIGQKSINYINVILENKNQGQKAVAMGSGGTYWAYRDLKIKKSFVVDGKLIVRLYRTKDTNSAPSAVGKVAKVEIVTENEITELKVPEGVYENDDPKTVHINIPTDSTGGIAQEGIAVLFGNKKQ